MTTVGSYSSVQNSTATDRLQRSLSRLADSTPTTDPATTDTTSDESNFSAAAQRLADGFDTQSEATRLQQQDQALQQAAALLSRIDELKSLHDDPTASDEARAAYEEEFNQLQSDLSSLSGTTIDGQPLFSTDEENPATDAPAGTDEAEGTSDATTVADAGTASEFATSFSDDFSNTDKWVSTYSEMSVSNHTFYPTSGSFGAVQTKQSFRGAMEIKFDLFLPGASDSLDVSVGETHLSNLTDTVNTNKWQWHSVRIAYDGAGNSATYVDGSDTAADTQSGLDPASGQLSLTNFGLGSAWIRNFSVSASGEPAAAPAPSAADVASVAQADELATLDSQTIDDATQHIADLQDANDAALAELSDTTSAVNPTDENDPALTSLSEAEDLTQQTTQEILQNSTAAFLAQANLDEESVLTLLG